MIHAPVQIGAERVRKLNERERGVKKYGGARAGSRGAGAERQRSAGAERSGERGYTERGVSGEWKFPAHMLTAFEKKTMTVMTSKLNSVFEVQIDQANSLARGVVIMPPIKFSHTSHSLKSFIYWLKALKSRNVFF